jgi:hypothetical protein
MGEIQRVLRPGGCALITFAWLHPLTGAALEILNREPALRERNMFYQEAPDVGEMLRSCPLLGIDGEGELAGFPGSAEFSAERIFSDPAVLVKRLAQAGPWKFRDETAALGMRHGGIGIRLRKDGGLDGASDGLLPAIEGPALQVGGNEPGVLLLDGCGSDLVEEIRRRFAVVKLRRYLHRVRDPAGVLEAVARHTDEIVIEDVFVDSGRHECAYIPADDAAEKSCLRGRMRISISWVYREFMGLGFQPTIERAFTGDGEVKDGMIRASRAKAIGEYPPLLMHVHLPKNAGTSFNHLLSASFGDRFAKLYFDDPNRRFDEFTLDEMVRSMPGALAVASHSIGVFPPIVGGRRGLYATLVRHPLARHRSYWRYAREHYSHLSAEHRAHLPGNFVSMNREEFTDFIADLAEARLVKMQTELICGHDDAEAAIRILSGFFFVGVVEQADRSVEVARKILREHGINLVDEPMGWVNRTVGGEDDLAPSGAAEERLLKHLESDVLLYEWALKNLGGLGCV